MGCSPGYRGFDPLPYRLSISHYRALLAEADEKQLKQAKAESERVQSFFASIEKERVVLGWTFLNTFYACGVFFYDFSMISMVFP